MLQLGSDIFTVMTAFQTGLRIDLSLPVLSSPATSGSIMCEYPAFNSVLLAWLRLVHCWGLLCLRYCLLCHVDAAFPLRPGIGLRSHV